MSIADELEIDGLLWSEVLPEAAYLMSVKALSPEALDEIARNHGIILPARYLQMACAVQGRCPSRTSFVVRDISESRDGALPELGTGQVRDIAFFALLSSRGTSPWSGDVVGVQLDLLAPHHRGLYPFAFDLRGNLLCLDYGEDWADQEPSVVYYDRARSTDDDIFPVSPDFSRFLDALAEDAGEAAASSPNEG